MKYLLSLSALSGLSAAWLPVVDKNIVSVDGINLFNSTSNGHKRSLPASKVRGVNLGTHFIFEPWISSDVWNSLGCEGTNSEFDCVLKLGQDAADAAFQKHWGSWTTQDDISQMVDYGLNTIRIPVGYWMREDIVYTDSEHFPRGGLAYLENICGWASDAGMYIIIDLHGAPGAQQPNQPFTGQYAPTAGFYVDYQYERALKFLEWIATNIHQNDKFRNVGMLEVVNEPLQNAGQVSSMRTSYYPNALDRIRAAETKLGVQASDYLHVQMMEEGWGSGDPNEALTDTTYAVYDKHRYLKWDTSLDVSHDSYISASCGESTGDKTIVGEWSLSVPDDVQWNSDWEPSGNTDFYKNWFAAQVIAYEKQLGWVFWTWRADLGDYRWSYRDAVTAGVVPKDLDSVYDMGVC